MRRKILSGLISILLLTLSFSCGNSASPVVPSIQEGAWTGTLDLSGETITFTVDADGVSNLHVIFIYWGMNLPPDTLTWTPDNATISDNEFQMVDTLNNGYYTYTMNINGTFDPPSDVSGMFGTAGSYDSLGTHYSTSDSCSWSGSHN